VSFLSAETHGIYSSRAASRYLAAPILTRGVHRSLEELIVIPSDGNKSYIRTLCRILQKDHGTVGMKGDVTDQHGALKTSYRGQVVGFPTGAASLAHMTGAPLVTGAVLRHGTLDHEVVIDEPIAVSRSLGTEQYTRAVVEEYAHRLEQRVAAHLDSRPASRFDKVQD
jgi:predicted LPLAT superfamily acyltransferase